MIFSSFTKEIAEKGKTLFLKPASSKPLAVLRIALSSILLVQATYLVADFSVLYGPAGYLQGDLRRFLLAPTLPFYVDWEPLGYFLKLPPLTLIRATFLLYTGALVFLLLGFYSRLAAVLVWLTHFLLKLNMGYNSSYGVDTFSHMFLFYLMLAPMNRHFSLDFLLGRVQEESPTWARVMLRFMQLHLFLIYFSTGIEKILGWQWRTGEVMWRAWMMPQFHVYDMSWVAWVPWLAKLIAWGTLFLEIGYPILLGLPLTRRWAGFAIVGLHAGIAITMHLWSFSAVMMCLTTCAFLISEKISFQGRESIQSPINAAA